MLCYRIVAVPELADSEKQSMFELLQRHFQNCSRPLFTADLREKSGVMLLEDEQGLLRGFSTYMFYRVLLKQEPVEIIFSGDTIIDKQAWGDSALFKAFLKVLLGRMAEIGGRRFFWFLISMGFRTYMMMPLFYRRFYPCYKEETPPQLRELLNLLGEQKFGESFRKETGVIRSRGECLSLDLACIPDQKLQNPHVRFFAERNKHWQQGDELACLTEVSFDNFKGIVRRLMTAVKG